MKFDILIITYERPVELLALLENMLSWQSRGSLLGEIIIINNGSKTSYKMVENFVDARADELPVRYLYNVQNVGVAAGRNQAAVCAKNDYFIFLDDDVEIHHTDFLAFNEKFWTSDFVRDNNVGVLSYRIFNFDTGDFQRNLFPHKKFNTKKYEHRFLTYYFAGAGHVLSKKLWQDVGAYSENFFYGMEEYDLSYRALAKSYTLAYDDTITVLHKIAKTGRSKTVVRYCRAWLYKSMIAWKYLPLLYFFTTSFLWSLFFLYKSKGHVFMFLQTWFHLFYYCCRKSRTTLPVSALAYCKKVGARLWY